MMSLKVHGHVVIICLGIPVVAGVVYNLKEMRARQLLLLNTARVKTEIDALMQIVAFQQIINDYIVNKVENITLIGVVNLHVLECQNSECPCKNEINLFDSTTGKAIEKGIGYHNKPIFLKHFTKQLYEDSLSKFISSPLLHIAYAGYLFNVMKNVHAAVLELNMAAKKKPSLRQQFAIYKEKYAMENYIKSESTKNYEELTSVIEFEELLIECHQEIDIVTNTQIEFWLQVTNQRPDLNILSELSNKMYEHEEKAKVLWKKLCKINSNYPRALILYGNYMLDIRNHEQIGMELIEKSNKKTNDESVNVIAKSADTLFSDKTVIIHISGNKESVGRITKINQFIGNIFGYTRAELIGHSINVIMPIIFANEHKNFLERYFKTGHQRVFNSETNLYAVKRDGFCFSIKLLVKQMPDLNEGIQYVGMIQEIQTEYDYILTNQYGVIDSYSSRISSSLHLESYLVKDSLINIQILAPELIKVFNPADKKNKKGLLCKFHEVGGQRVTFITPKDFVSQMQSKEPNKMKNKKGIASGKKERFPLYRSVNKILNNNEGIDNKQINPQQLLQSYEYKEPDVKKTVFCEIIDEIYGEDTKPLKVRIFKIAGLAPKQAASGAEYSNDENEYSNDFSFDFRDDYSAEEFKENEKSKFMKSTSKCYSPLQRLEIKKEEAKVEETKTTEQLYGNLVTTDERKETVKDNFLSKPLGSTELNLKSNIKGKFKVETLKKIAKSYVELPKVEDQIVKKEGQFFTEIDVQKSSGGSEKSTIRLSLGSLRGPVPNLSIKAEKNTVYPGNESISISDSNRSLKYEKKIVSNLKASTLVYDTKYLSFADSLKISREEENELKNESNEDKVIIRKRVKPSAISSFTRDARVSSVCEGTREEKKFDINYADIEKLKHTSKFEEVAINVKLHPEKFNSSAEPDIENKIGTEFLKRKQSGKDQDYLKKSIRSPNKYNDFRIMMHSFENEVIDNRQDDKEIKLRKSLLAFNKKVQKNKKMEAKTETNKKNESCSESNSKSDDEESDIEKSPKHNINRQDSETLGTAKRSLYSLRSAIDEKYVPLSIQRMKHGANLLFLLIFAITIVNFVLQLTLYRKIEGDIQSINYSEQRINSLIDIDFHAINMMVISAFYEIHDESGDLSPKEVLFAESQRQLKMFARALKIAQMKFSQKSDDFSKKALEKINPSNVILKYMTEPGEYVQFPYTVWQGVMEIVVSAYKISSMNISEVNETNDQTVYFLAENLLNNILLNVYKSTSTIMDEIKDVKSNNIVIFTILLSIASFSLLLSTILLFPLLNRIKKTKQEVYELFMYLRKQNVREYLYKCRRFLNTFQVNPEADVPVDEGEQEEIEVDVISERLEGMNKGRHYSSSKRKFKKLVLHSGLTILKFIFLVIVMEGYFILNYLLSILFLKQVLSITEELKLLHSRLPKNGLLLVSQKMALYKNYTITIMNQNVTVFIAKYHKELYDDEERFLDTFSKNYDYHTSSYNHAFNDIAFSNVCRYIPEFLADINKCESFSQGILKKGIYSSNIKHWDILRQINYDYLISERDIVKQHTYLHSEELLTAEEMRNVYLNASVNILLHNLNNDIKKFFKNEDKQNEFMFKLYLVYLIVVYIFFWNGFLSDTQKELWKTKSVLSILTPETILSVSEIKSFIFSNSSTMILYRTS